MNDNEIRHAFEKMTETVQPERVENRVRERLAAKEREERKRVRFPRAAVVFACILALTAVSAGAYGIVYLSNVQIRVLEEDHLDYEVTFGLEEGGATRVTLSEQVMAELPKYNPDIPKMAEGENIYDRGKIFESWEEAEEWLGCDLLTSDLFGGIPENIVFGGEILLYTAATDGGKELNHIMLMGSNELPFKSFYCRTGIIIPLVDDYPGVVYAAHESSETDVEEIITYEMENGMVAEIAVTTIMREGYSKARYSVRGYVYKDGIFYEYTLSSSPGKSAAITYMKKLLDSLH